jgi:hypothetical protein
MTMQVEDHILRTVAQIPAHELRPLAAGLLQRLINIDGVATVMTFFPELEPHWIGPPAPFNWPNSNVA